MIELNGAWKMRCTADGIWQDAQVPGSVYTDLLRNGAMKDPFWGENEEEIRELSAFDYAYERTFSVGEKELAKKRLFLVCEGLDTLAEIRINGKKVAETDNMHRTYRIEIKQDLHIGENVIHILLRSPLQYAKKAAGKKRLWGVSSTVDGYQQIRKAHSMFGWDWGPQLPDLGIWRDIYIEEVQEGKISDFYVTQRHGQDQVTLDIAVENEFTGGSEGLELEFILQDRFGNVLYREKQDACEQQEFQCTVEKPDLWWPNVYGEQPLYEVGLLLSNGEKQVWEKTKRIGLRTLTIKKEKDRWGESFGFEINGKVIFTKGANYIPEDNLLGRTGKERTEKLLENCVRANFNCVRVWGGGNYPADYFYDLCDELGLIVWQDFMFACAVYDLTEYFEANIKAEFEDNIRRIRNHASLAMWCGNNEMESGWDHWGLPPNEKLRQDYLTMFERIIPETLTKLDPQTFYWPSSPSAGGGFDHPDLEGAGDAHYWDVWHGKKPFEDFRKKYFRFASEYGFQSVPSIKTVKTFTTEEEYNLFSNVMEAHQKCVDNGHGNMTLMYYLFQYYQNPKDFETMIYTTQILQGDCLDTAISHFRSNKGRCLGSTYWQLNDCNPVISWATIDYYGRWKASHYIVKRSYAPVLLTAQIEDGTAAFYLSNERRSRLEGTFRYRIVHQEKGILQEGSKHSTVCELAAAKIEEIELPPLSREDARNSYLVFEIWENGEVLTQEFALLVKPKQFHFLNPHISVEWKETADVYEMTVTADAFARRVGIEFEEIDAILSDNYFDLEPEISRVIAIQKKDLAQNYTEEDFRKQLKIISNYDIIEHREN